MSRVRGTGVVAVRGGRVRGGKVGGRVGVVAVRGGRVGGVEWGVGRSGSLE